MTKITTYRERLIGITENVGPTPKLSKAELVALAQAEVLSGLAFDNNLIYRSGALQTELERRWKLVRNSPAYKSAKEKLSS